MSKIVNKEVSIELNGKIVNVPEGITVKRALEIGGYKVLKYPEKGSLFAPCEVGGCWSCVVEVNNEPKPACITPVRKGLRINSELPQNYVPKRIIHGFSGHTAGGVGTPYWLKDHHGYIETACFAAGCNLRCPQCQNWETTYKGKGKPLTPSEAAELMTASRKKVGVDRMAVSGGESTLNRRWLVEYVSALKELNPDSNARIHVDTNATILTGDYIDMLVEAGMTDIGPDLKGYYPSTFMQITGIEDKGLAEKYLNTAWEAVQYLIESFKDSVFTGVGIPYNKELISLQEIGLMGKRLFEIDPEIQVCVLDYRPEFKRLDLVKPQLNEMVQIHKILTSKGLKTVICQTEYGHIGPL
jgi:pyruvate formate lyase activating enzyme